MKHGYLKIGLLFLLVQSGNLLYAQDAEELKSAEENSSYILEPKKTEPVFSPFCPSQDVYPDTLISFAKNYINCRYQGGGTGPDRFDCSGFTSFVYGHFGYNLDHSSGGQVANGKELEKQDSLQKGDLVFFKGRNSHARRIGHVGMVTSVNSDGTFSFIHASCSSGVVIDNSEAPYYKSRYVTATRVLPQKTTSVLPIPAEPISPNVEPTIEKEIITHPVTKRHKVTKGETLFSIAKQYGVTVKQLKSWNDISKDRIKPGEKLIVAKKLEKLVSQKNKKQKEKQSETIATASQDLSQNVPSETVQSSEAESSQAESTVEKDATSSKHIVTKGETLFSISKQYGITVKQLKDWNDLSGDGVQAGQKLVVIKQDKQSPPSSKKYKKHTVKKGETLTSIARNNGCTIKQLQSWNNISGGHLQIGQKLTIR